jgi:hypothetical protein
VFFIVRNLICGEEFSHCRVEVGGEGGGCKRKIG